MSRSLLPDSSFDPNALSLAFINLMFHDDDVPAELLENEVIPARHPFSNLPGSKVRPAVVVNVPHTLPGVVNVPRKSFTGP